MNGQYVHIFLIVLALFVIYDYQSEIGYRCHDCNVILISIDALRPDHLGI